MDAPSGWVCVEDCCLKLDLPKWWIFDWDWNGVG